MAKAVQDGDDVAKRKRWHEFQSAHPRFREEVVRRTLLSTVQLLKINKLLRKRSDSYQTDSEELASRITDSLCTDFKSTWGVNVPMVLDFTVTGVPEPHMTIHLYSSKLSVDFTVEVPPYRY